MKTTPEENTIEVEEAAKDWLFAGDEPKPEDEIVYKEFVDFLADFLYHQLQKAREEVYKEVRRHIQNCEGRHTQQAVYSTFHDALTQVCYGCMKVRSTIKR